MVANNWTDLIDGNIMINIIVNEYGNLSFSGTVWTATSADGTTIF